MIIPFGTQSYQLRSRPLSAQRMVNTYLVQAPPSAKTLAANVPSYGIKAFTTAGNGPMRGGLVVNDQLYVVSGNALLSINSAGVATSLGAIPNTDRVSMTGDGTNVFVATQDSGYVYDGSSVAQVTDGDFPGADDCDFLDGYLIVTEPDSGRLWVAGPYTPGTWNALDFTTAEGAPDDLVGVIVDHREVFAFGRQTTEVLYNSGDADFPLTRTDSGFIEVGLLSKHAKGKINNSVYFVAHDCTVRRLDGYTPVIISTDAVSQAIEGYANKQSHCQTFVESGHSMVAFSFEEGTWVYDASTNLWHERQSYGYSNWRAAFVLRAFGKLLIGDTESNKIGEADPETFMEWDQPLVSSATAPAIARENQLIRHGLLELVFEQGVGTSGQGADPQVMLQWSDDGGRTWSNEYHRALGRVGEYTRSMRFHRLGASRDRVYRYSVSDPVRRTLIQATLDAA